MHRNWRVNRTNPEFLAYLAGKASISPVLAQILVNRGIKDEHSIQGFLDPKLDDLHDPFLLPDMDKAVERIKSAVDRDEKVFVHGDYDADGLTATAILLLTLKAFGLTTSYHIPNRIVDGYGLSNSGIQKAKDSGASLIITVDCGITSVAEVVTAGSMGMDVIITDHHEPPEVLPRAAAVINPRRVDSVYPFEYLAGVGVAFKLIQALTAAHGSSSITINAEELLDIVALGTIADSVPLIGENRVFVTHGLRAINTMTCRTGLQAMKEAARFDKPLSSTHLAYTLIPRINAAGRLGDASEVVRLLMTEDTGIARGIAGLLDEQNRKRQKIEADVLKSATGMLDPERIDSAIVLSSADWHPGVIGIVASRLVDMFYRPVFLFAEEGDVAKGSARSIPPFHLYQAISEQAELLLAFGGHRQAAGIKLALVHMQEFRKSMNAAVEKNLSEEDMVPVLEIDASLNFTDLNFNLIRELSLLEPFGNSNSEPMFGTKEITIVNHRIVGKNHLKMQLKQQGLNFDSIGFSMGDQLTPALQTASLDVAYVPAINEWNGTRNLQLNLKAMRPGR